MEHARYSPSSSSRWLNCPASVQRSEGLESSTEEATEGSFLHEIAETCARWGLDPFALVGTEYAFRGQVYEFTYEYALFIELGLEWLNQLEVDEVFYEQQLVYHDEEFGTTDIVAYNSSEKHLYIADWKFGRVGVAAKDNTQLGCYAIGAIKTRYPETEKVTLAVLQPRLGFWVDECTYDTLDWFTELSILIDQAYGEEHVQAGSKQCLYCPARVLCREYVDYVLDLIKVFSEWAEMDITKLEDSEVAHVLLNAKVLTNFLKDVEELALTRMEQGRLLPGLKLIEGRKPAANWEGDELEVLATLVEKTGLAEEDLCQTKLKSPAQVLEVIGKSQPENTKIVADLSKRGAPSKKVVPEDSKGREVASLRAEFNDF